MRDAFFEQRERERERSAFCSRDIKARVVSSSHHHRSAFYIPICCACAGKKANVTRENKEEKEEKSRPKKVSVCVHAREWEKVFFSSRAYSKADARREKHLVSKDIYIILPQI